MSRLSNMNVSTSPRCRADTKLFFLVFSFVLLTLGTVASSTEYDVIIRHGTLYDGNGTDPTVGDVAIQGDILAAIGQLDQAQGRLEIDATGLAVAPGFINMLSQAMDTLIVDGHSQSDIRQGVTLEIFGEGWSMGPLNEPMKKGWLGQQGDVRFDIPWTTLGQYLDYLVARGISPNVASFVGATTLRIHEIGYEDRPPTPQEMQRMRDLTAQAMEEGALGVGSSLIYAPAFYAKTDELIELAKVAARYNGMYISHIRSEGTQLLQAVDELISIAKAADISAEIYHLKAAGKSNWDKLDRVFEKIESARAAGLKITANMYTYTAGATGLDAAMPPWVQEGGYQAWAERLQNPQIRQRIKQEMLTSTDEWENMYLAAGGADGILLIGFKNDALKPLTGKRLAEVAKMRKKSPEETAMDLVIEDGSRVTCIYFIMSEENVKKKITKPWISLGSDAGSMANEGVFLKSSTHPRAYGNVVRLLGRYVREEKIISLQEAVRRMTSLPAKNMHMAQRGLLKAGYFADVVVFDPHTIQDHATYEQPHQYATGMLHVFVNGVQVLKDGEHTGAMPGRVVRGPGWKP